MKLLVEKEFELWEKHTHTEHDTPAIGCSRTYETSRKSRGSYKTKARAEKAKKSLIAGYLTSGIWKISRESTPNNTVLYEQSVTKDIIIWVQAKIVSEKPVR